MNVLLANISTRALSTVPEQGPKSSRPFQVLQKLSPSLMFSMLHVMYADSGPRHGHRQPLVYAAGLRQPWVLD
jgi:hypothetical protein